MPTKTQKLRIKRSSRLEPEDNEILNAVGAGRALGISSRLVLRLARSGELPGKKVGKEWRFRRSALLRWLEEPPLPTDPKDLVKHSRVSFPKK